MDVDEKNKLCTDMAEKFHNLEGVQIGERRRDLYKWLKQTRFSDEELNEVLPKLVPKNYLEELFKVEILIYFKRTSELLEILKAGNEVFISKIIKQQWFFEEVIKTMDEESFVNELLPHLSFSIRMKALKKVSRCVTEVQMDKIVDVLLSRYGLFLAKQFLTSCSNEYIESFLKTHEVVLNETQCKELLHKDQGLLLLHFENRKVCNFDKSFWVYVARNNFDFFRKIENKFCSKNIKLGKRVSRKIVKNRKSDVIKDVDYYSDRLRKEIMVRSLKPTFKEIYLRRFSRNSYNFDYVDEFKELKYFPRKYRWEIFSETFAKVMDKSPLDCLDLFGEDYAGHFPTCDISQKWAKIQYKKHNSTNYLQYMNFEEAFPLIKEKINVTSDINSRQSLLKALIINCKNNDSLSSLITVLKYISYRHKNERAANRRRILSQLEQSFDPLHFEELHWKYINEQIQLLRVINEFDFGNHKKLCCSYLCFLFTQNKPCESELSQYVKDVIQFSFSFRFKGVDFPVAERYFLINMARYIFPQPKTGDALYNIGKYLNSITDFNTKKVDHFIDFHDVPLFKEFIVDLFSKTCYAEDAEHIEYDLKANILSYYLDVIDKVKPIFSHSELPNIIKNIKDYRGTAMEQVSQIVLKLMKKSKLPETQTIVGIYFNDFFTNCREDHVILPFLKYIFKYDLLTVQKYFDIILNKNISGNSHIACCNFSNTIRKCSHLNLDSQLMSFIKSKLEQLEFQDSNRTEIEYIFECYSNTQDVSDFISAVEKYLVPTADKLDLENDEQKQLYYLQCMVLKCFKNVIEPSKMPQLVLKYCRGDYLQSALRALYSIFYRTKTMDLQTYLDILVKRPVSAQKHALFLTAELLDKNHFTNILSYLLSQAKNTSTKKCIFSSAFKYFVKNPSDDLFKIILNSMHLIDKNDQETLFMLCNLKVTSKYEPAYIEKVWTFFENLEKEEVLVESYLNTLLLKMKGKLAPKLSFEFFDMVIRKYYFINSYSYSVLNFAFSALAESAPEQFNKYLAVFFDVIEEFKGKEDTNCQQLNEILSNLQCYAETGKHIIKPFSERWKSLFDGNECFEQFLLLDLLVIKCDYLQILDKFSQKIVDLLEHLVSQYELIIVEIFCKTLKKIIETKDRNDIVCAILKYKLSKITCLLATYMVENISKNNDGYNCYSEIVTILRKSKDPLIKIFYKHYVY